MKPAERLIFFFLQDCYQVETDGKRHSAAGTKQYGVYDGSMVNLDPPVASELKDGQWLGVEVKSQGPGGKVIVCAHRYSTISLSQHSFLCITGTSIRLQACAGHSGNVRVNPAVVFCFWGLLSKEAFEWKVEIWFKEEHFRFCKICCEIFGFDVMQGFPMNLWRNLL